MLIFYLLSITFPFLILLLKKVNIVSPAYVFLSFHTLYSTIIILSAKLNYDRLPLLGQEELIIVHTYISISVNIALGLAYLIFFKKSTHITNIVRTNYNWSLFLFIYFGLFLFLIFFGQEYGWHAVTHGLGKHKLASLYFYLRIFFAAMIVFYFIYHKQNKILFYILLFLQLIVTIIDGGRTTIIPTFVLIIYFFISRNGFKMKYLIALIIAIILMLMTRAFIMTGDSIVADMIASIFIEGAFGSYASLNVLNLLINSNVQNYTFGLSYIFDPLIWSIPFADTSLTFFKQFIFNNFQNVDFTPMGGFYFIAESNIAFPFVGPFLITLIVFSMFAILERKQKKETFLFISLYCSLGFLFAKVIFGNAIKIFVIYFVSLIIINILLKLRLKHETRLHNNK